MDLDILAARIVDHLRLPPDEPRQDAMQEARLRLIQRQKQGVPPDHLYMRVWGDMKDLYGREWKRRYTAQTYPLGVTDPPAATCPDIGRVAQDTALAMDVSAALERLTAAQSDVVRSIMAGQSQADIAARRGTTVTAVKRIYSRAKITLRKALAAYGEDDADQDR